MQEGDLIARVSIVAIDPCEVYIRFLSCVLPRASSAQSDMACWVPASFVFSRPSLSVVLLGQIVIASLR